MRGEVGRHRPSSCPCAARAPGFPTWLQRLRLGSGLGICFPSVLWSPALSWGSEPLADAASSTSVFQTQRITHRCVYPGFWAWLAVRTDASSSLRTRGACEATQGPRGPGHVVTDRQVLNSWPDPVPNKLSSLLKRLGFWEIVWCFKSIVIWSVGSSFQEMFVTGK